MSEQEQLEYGINATAKGGADVKQLADAVGLLIGHYDKLQTQLPDITKLLELHGQAAVEGANVGKRGVTEEVEQYKKLIAVVEQVGASVKNLQKQSGQLPSSGLGDFVKELTKDLDSGDIERFTGKLKDLVQNILTAKDPLGALNGAISSFLNSLGPAGATIAGLQNIVQGTFNGLLELAKGYSNLVGETEKVRLSTGATYETINTLGLGFKQQGDSLNDLADILNNVSSKTVEAATANGAAKDALAFFKVEARDASGQIKNVNQVIKELATNYFSVEESAQKATHAQTLFGEEGSRQVPSVFARYKELNEAVAETNHLFSEEGVRSAKEFQKALGDLDLAIDNIRNGIGREEIGVFTELAKEAAQAIKEIKADPETVASLKNLLNTISEIVFFVGQLEISKFRGLTNILREIGVAISALQSPLQTIKKFLDLPPAAPGLINLFKQLREAASLNLQEQQKLNTATQEAAKAQDDQGKSAQDQVPKLEELKKAINALIEANRQLVDSTKTAADAQIAGIEEQVRIGDLTAKEGAEARLTVQKKLNSDLIELSNRLLDDIRKKAADNADLQGEVAKAETAAQKARTDATRAENKIRAEIEQATANEIKRINEKAKSDRAIGVAEELAEIKKAEDDHTTSHAQAARERTRITIEELNKQIAAEQALSQNPDVGIKEREAAAQRLADLKTKLRSEELKGEQDLNAAINRDAQESESEREALFKQEQQQQQTAIDGMVAARRKQGDDEMSIAEASLLARIGLIDREIASLEKEKQVLIDSRAERSKIIEIETEIAKKTQDKERAISDSTKERFGIAESLLNQQKAREDAALEDRKRKAEDLGLTEQQIALETSQVKLEQINREIQLIQNKISLADEEKLSANELIDLKTKLIQLTEQQASAQNEVTKATEATNAAANQTSQSVQDLYKSSGAAIQGFHDTGTALFQDIQTQNTNALTAIANAEAAAVAAYREYLVRSYAAITAATKQASEERKEAYAKEQEDLIENTEKRDEALRQLERNFTKFKKENLKEQNKNHADAEQERTDETKANEENRTAIVNEEAQKQLAIEREKAEESRDIRNSQRDEADDIEEKAGEDSYEQQRKFLNDLVELEKERQGAKTQAEKDGIDARIAARKKEEEDRLAREKAANERNQANDEQFKKESEGVTDPELLKKLKADFDARKKNNNEKTDLEEEFQEDYQAAVAAGEDELAAQLKAAYEDRLKKLDDQLKKQLDKNREEYQHEQELAAAAKAAEEIAYQEKLSKEEERHQKALSDINKRESEKNKALQTALDDERKRRNNQREKIESDFADSEKRIRDTLQDSLDKIKAKLNDSIDAAVGRLNDFGKSGSSALDPLISRVDQLISRTQQALSLTQQLAGGNSTGDAFNNLNNITSANGPSNASSSSSTNNITNKLGSGFPSTNNVTTSPIDSSDKTGSDNASDNGKDQSKGKGSAEQANTKKVNPADNSSSSTTNVTTSPIDSSDSNSGEGDTSDSDKDKSKDKGTVKQVAPISGSEGKGTVQSADSPDSTDQQTNVTTSDDQVDDNDVDKGGKKPVKIKPQSNRDPGRAHIDGKHTGNPLETKDSNTGLQNSGRGPQDETLGQTPTKPPVTPVTPVTPAPGQTPASPSAPIGPINLSLTVNCQFDIKQNFTVSGVLSDSKTKAEIEQIFRKSLAQFKGDLIQVLQTRDVKDALYKLWDDEHIRQLGIRNPRNIYGF